MDRRETKTTIPGHCFVPQVMLIRYSKTMIAKFKKLSDRLELTDRKQEKFKPMETRPAINLQISGSFHCTPPAEDHRFPSSPQVAELLNRTSSGTYFLPRTLYICLCRVCIEVCDVCLWIILRLLFCQLRDDVAILFKWYFRDCTTLHWFEPSTKNLQFIVIHNIVITCLGIIAVWAHPLKYFAYVVSWGFWWVAGLYFWKFFF